MGNSISYKTHTTYTKLTPHSDPEAWMGNSVITQKTYTYTLQGDIEAWTGNSTIINKFSPHKTNTYTLKPRQLT